MTQRLPIPGSDDNTWGGILNGFLEVSHAADGTLNAAVGGDLSGNLPNPTVAKVNGVSVTGTPSNGQILTASSSSAASWQSGSSGANYPNSSGAATVVPRPTIYDVRDYGAHCDNSQDDSAAIASAFTAMSAASGHADGVLLIPDNTYVASTVTLNGNYTTVTETAEWTTGGTEQFALDCQGSVRFASGVGVGFSISGFYGAQLNIRLKNGGYGHTATSGAAINATSQNLTLPAGFSPVIGQYVRVEGAGAAGEVPLTGQITGVTSATAVTVNIAATTTVSNARVFVGDIGILIGNLLNVTVDLYANNFAGLVSHLNGTSMANQVTQSTVNRLYTQSCGMALGWINVAGGFGALIDVWDDNNSNGSVFDIAADITLIHWEGYSPSTQTVGLLLNQCSDFAVEVVSLGDSAAVLMKVYGGNVGSFNRIRVGGSPNVTMGNATVEGLQLTEVTSIHIDNLQTARCAKGLHIRGGTDDITILMHDSVTTDTNPVYIEAGPVTSAPDTVSVTGYYRFNYGEVVYIASSITGGNIRLSGFIDSNINQQGSGGNYAIDCQSTAVILDVSGLTQVHRSTLAGAVFCATATNLIGLDRANISNTTFAAGDLWYGSTIAGGRTRLAGDSSGTTKILTSNGSGGLSWGTAADPPSYIGPEHDGLLAWTADPRYCSSSYQYPTAGRCFFMMVPVASTITVGHVKLYIFNSPGGLSNTYIGFLDSTGTPVAGSASADISATMSTSGLQTAALGSSVTLTGGVGAYYYFAVVIGAFTTAPTWIATASNSAGGGHSSLFSPNGPYLVAIETSGSRTAFPTSQISLSSGINGTAQTPLFAFTA